MFMEYLKSRECQLCNNSVLGKFTWIDSNWEWNGIHISTVQHNDWSHKQYFNKQFNQTYCIQEGQLSTTWCLTITCESYCCAVFISCVFRNKRAAIPLLFLVSLHCIPGVLFCDFATPAFPWYFRYMTEITVSFRSIWRLTVVKSQNFYFWVLFFEFVVLGILALFILAPCVLFLWFCNIFVSMVF